jgi:hypothetical protein
VFTFFTHATSVEVWNALTDATQIGKYLDGLALQSDWNPLTRDGEWSVTTDASAP